MVTPTTPNFMKIKSKPVNSPVIKHHIIRQLREHMMIMMVMGNQQQYSFAPGYFPVAVASVFTYDGLEKDR